MAYCRELWITELLKRKTVCMKVHYTWILAIALFRLLD